MNHSNADKFSKIYDNLYEDLVNEIYTDQKLRNKYLPFLENYIQELGVIENDLRAGSFKEIEIYRKFGKWF